MCSRSPSIIERLRSSSHRLRIGLFLPLVLVLIIISSLTQFSGGAIVQGASSSSAYASSLASSCQKCHKAKEAFLWQEIYKYADSFGGFYSFQKEHFKALANELAAKYPNWKKAKDPSAVFVTYAQRFNPNSNPSRLGCRDKSETLLALWQVFPDQTAPWNPACAECPRKQ